MELSWALTTPPSCSRPSCRASCAWAAPCAWLATPPSSPSWPTGTSWTTRSRRARRQRRQRGQRRQRQPQQRQPLLRRRQPSDRHRRQPRVLSIRRRILLAARKGRKTCSRRQAGLGRGGPCRQLHNQVPPRLLRQQGRPD